MSPTGLRTIIAVPANNTTMEVELSALCPELAPFGVARVKLPGDTLNRETLPAYIENTFATIAPFATQQPQVLVYGCTAAGFLLGREECAGITAALESQSGAIVVSTGEAMVDVLKHEGATETAVITPYLEAVNEGLRNYLASGGIAIEVLESFACKDTDELGRITEQQVLEMAHRTVTARSKALFIACSQLPTLGIIDSLREEFRIPVWSSISATAWLASKAFASSHGNRTAAGRGSA